MAEITTENVTIPLDLFAALQTYAEKHNRSVRDVAEEAIRAYLDDGEMTDVRRYHALKAESLGLSLDDYVMSLVKEDRREGREQQAA